MKGSTNLTRPGGLRPRGPPTPSLAGPHDPRSAPAGAPVARLARYAARPQRVQNSRFEPHNGLTAEKHAAGLRQRSCQLAAEIRMGDPDQRRRALAQRLAPEIDRAVLGDDPVNVPARGYYPRTGLDRGHDARRAAAGSRGRELDDRDAASRERGAANEIHLPADARVEAETD